MTPQEMRDRLDRFAIAVVNFCKPLLLDPQRRRLADQLQDAGTSVAANYRAACRAQTRPGFIAKLSIAVEEADESVFWLGVLEESGMSSELLSALKQESGEILAMLGASRRTASGKRRR